MSAGVNANWGGDNRCSFDDNDIHELARGFACGHRCTKCHQLLRFGIRERTRKQGFLRACEHGLSSGGDARREIREPKRDDGQHSAHNGEGAVDLWEAQTGSPHGDRFVIPANAVGCERTSQRTRYRHRE